MEDKNMSLTNEIYQALVDGLKTGLDWTHFLAKYGASKGPLYNAIGRFFNDMGPKVQEFNEVQAKLDQRGLELDSLDSKIKEAGSSLAPLEERRNALNEGIEILEAKLAEKNQLLEHAGELGKLGFDIERLRQLREALTEIGAKSGLTGKEAVSKFFEDLKDYEAVLEAGSLLKGLQNQVDTKKREAGKWQAETERVERQHKELKEATDAMQALLKRGVKAEQIVSWNGIVSKLGGPEELRDKLGQYKSMSELLDAKKTEMENCGKKVIELGAQIKALNEQKVEIEGAIKSLSTSGVKKITEVSDKAIGEIKSLLAEIRAKTKRLADLKAEAGKLEKELMYARYFTTGDQAVLKELPKEVVLTFLERAATYCKLNELNPEVKMTNGISRKFPLIYPTTEVTLLEIIAWAEAGLAGAVQ